MGGYYSSSEADGMHAPRKPILKSVDLPHNSPFNSPTFPNGHYTARSRASWMPHIFRTQTPAPPASQRRDSSFHEIPTTASRHVNAHNTTRTRKLSGSSNVSDRKHFTLPSCILKKPGSLSRSSTPVPPVKDHAPPVKPDLLTTSKSSYSEELSSSRHYHHRKASSSSSSSKIDGYSSDSHTLWKRKLSPDEEASKLSAYGDACGKPVAGSRKLAPSAVPMKAEAIALSWPLTETSRNSRKQRINICFDVAFDPRKSRGVTTTCVDALHAHRDGIRCLDVFEAVYKTLQHRLTDEDFRTFGEARIQRCYSFCLQRCVDSPGLSEYNKQTGMRRVDLLRGRRFFRGLVQSGDDWVLHLDDYSGSSRH
ncbi:hypothetical protein GYMLUDRAFT_605882 [Collybiopsis luxurians FD-317 M1]|uniref:DUF6699 domain-containing protein n=1 Tax=Collybiopsis luxurians FD-317 M1 TaxID=944289 RepID=A0A0D0CWB0_9AGAR|nr:hypothetical protein GYMLUDRAFT_605882 [Collybiopsis luxurians FD-317 M1]